jgi:ubiquinone/menaquinone biosynthesis C-methylase UbiE
VEPSSTGDPRLRGALPSTDITTIVNVRPGRFVGDTLRCIRLEEMVSDHKYFATGASFQAERERLSMLERLFDEVTRQFLRQIGVNESWRCCEIGAGGGSMTRWLARLVGPEGRVVAVDLNTRFLAEIDEANVDVIEGDFLSDTPVGGPFDLVFTRFVLMHLSEPGKAVLRMAELAKPNGRVFAFEGDLCTLSAADPDHPDASRFDEVRQKMEVYHRDHHVMSYRAGRRLPKQFEDAGLVDIATSAWSNVSRGGSLQAQFWRRTFEVTGERMITSGALSPEEHELRLSVMSDPTFRFVEPLWFCVSGRKPSI